MHLLAPTIEHFNIQMIKATGQLDAQYFPTLPIDTTISQSRCAKSIDASQQTSRSRLDPKSILIMKMDSGRRV